jgi:hypothetical protein
MRLLKLLLFLFLVSACSLQKPATNTEIELTVVVNTPAATIPTFTPENEASPTATLTLTAPASETPRFQLVSSSCNPRTDLPTYTVVVGDSLSSIATRTGSRVDDLVEWNCLANANMIVVGMRLQVAREAWPATLTPTPTLTPSPTSTSQQTSSGIVLGPFGALGLDPALQAGSPQDWTDFLIAPQTTITIIWSGIDPQYYVDVSTIEFFYTSDAGTYMSMGVDRDKSNGMSISWAAPANVSGRITATAIYQQTSKIISPAIHVRDR